MKYIFSILFLFITVTASAQKQFVVDPDAEIREISGSFNSIKISSGIHVYISKGDTEALAISASEEKYKAAIKTEIVNNELRISYSGEKIHFGNNRMSVYVACKELAQLHISGASSVVFEGVMDVPVLNMQVSGASDVKGALKVNELNVKLSGASDMRLSGTAKNVNIESSGASDVKAYELTAETCNVKVSGASDVNITVSGELSANATGASDIHYRGTPQIKVKQASGASSIARVG